MRRAPLLVVHERRCTGEVLPISPLPKLAGMTPTRCKPLPATSSRSSQELQGLGAHSYEADEAKSATNLWRCRARTPWPIWSPRPSIQGFLPIADPQPLGLYRVSAYFMDFRDTTIAPLIFRGRNNGRISKSQTVLETSFAQQCARRQHSIRWQPHTTNGS